MGTNFEVLSDTKVEHALQSFLLCANRQKDSKHTHRDGYGCRFLLFKKPDMY